MEKEKQEKQERYVSVVKVRLTAETVEAYGGDFERIRERAERYINNPRYYPDEPTEGKEKEVKDNDG